MTQTFNPLTHAFQTSHLLPLRWLRLPLLLASVGLSCVCIAVGAQALNKSAMLEKKIMSTARSTGADIMFDMDDIKATSTVLTLVASLIAISSTTFAIALGVDWIRHLIRLTRSMTTIAKERSTSSDEAAPAPTRPPVRLPLSTRTLGCQTFLLSFLSVWILAVLIPSTLFTRTRSGHLTVQGGATSFSLDAVYWDYGFLRCLAAAPWFTLIFSAPASAVTWVAWKYLPSSLRDGKY